MGQDPQAVRSAMLGVLSLISPWPVSSWASCRARKPMHMLMWSRLLQQQLSVHPELAPPPRERASPSLSCDSHTPWDIRMFPGTLASLMTAGSLERIWTQPCLV